MVFLTALFFGDTMAAEQKIIEKRGGKVKVVKYKDGSWQLLVNDKPYFIRGVVFNPVNIGQAPDDATQQDWMDEDDNQDGIIDIPYQSWLDKNKNNIRDDDEPLEGDFSLLKKMGVNTIRLYHLPSNNSLVGDIYKSDKNTENLYNHAINKKLLRDLYQKYGIRVIAGHFLGSWTVGAGVMWKEGVDYNNPQQRENIKNSVKAMVLDNKDEPYILMWLLGNENNIATWSNMNAPHYPEVYASLVGEIADMIHQLDPNHPVAVCDGDSLDYNTLKHYAKVAPGIDIVAYNAYRGMFGFGNLWQKSKEVFDRPIFISEFGQYAYSDKGEDEEIQYRYFKNAWVDIEDNAASKYWAEHQGQGNVIGGVIFHWTDQWYLNWTPFEQNTGSRAWVENQPVKHDEYWGILSMGNGSDTLMRQKRKTYELFTQIWNGSKK
ncbi:MAG: hypothetical protein A3D10_03210 [Omnitrophica WOR_2 bacterium RIFCSPHIGHO2_02_FULL_48_11]|nr:MAG: hypothetical protein A3D10_03210 [Omnitrophica WOR_2 bacterium RIFCSPHIGHO2_02_FULL_48_11]